MGRVDELEDAGHVTTRLAVGWDAAESSHRGFASIVGCQRIGNLELVKERSQVPTQRGARHQSGTVEKGLTGLAPRRHSLTAYTAVS